MEQTRVGPYQNVAFPGVFDDAGRYLPTFLRNAAYQNANEIIQDVY
jgi:hypothetical protein